jgi:DHA1 family 2-module integral membrane pump EmrD-like MFS transporter
MYYLHTPKELKMNKNPLMYLLLAIGLMTVGQLPAGIYLPSLVNMSATFGVSTGEIQYVVGIYLMAYGGSQLIYGPLSDHYGRKPVAVGGLILFAIGSIVSIFAGTFGMMNLGSLIQGLGLGSVAVISSAVLRDLHDGKKLHASMSSLSAAVIVTPLAAPILGSYLQKGFGWRADFVFLLLYGLIMLALSLLYLQETNANVQKGWLTPRQVLRNYVTVMKTKSFLSYGFCRILALSGGTTYAINAPLLFVHLLKLSPLAYAWVAVIPGSGFFMGSMVAKYVGKTYRLETVLLLGGLCLFIGSLSLLVLGLSLPLSIPMIVIPMLIYMCGNGITFPTALTGAILPLGALAGTATAFIGSTQNLGRGFFSSLLGSLHPQSVMPLAIMISILSSLCLLISGYKYFKAEAVV